MIYEVSLGEKTYRVELTQKEGGWRCTLDDRPIILDVAAMQDGVLSLLIDGRSYEVKQETTAAESNIVVGYQRFSATVRDPRSLRSRRSVDAGSHGPKKITAPMPGKVVR